MVVAGVRFVGGDRALVARGGAQRGGGPPGRLLGPRGVGLRGRDQDDGFELLAGESAFERDGADLGAVRQGAGGLDQGAGAATGDPRGPAHPPDRVQRAVVATDLAFVEHRQHQQEVRTGRVLERVELPEGGLELGGRRVAQPRQHR